MFLQSHGSSLDQSEGPILSQVSEISRINALHNRGNQWFLIPNVMKQGLDIIKKSQKILVPGH